MLALLLTVPLLASAPAPSPENAAASAAGQCVGVWVSAPQAKADASRQPSDGRASFSATHVQLLEFSTLLRRRSSGPHVLELKVYAPQGHLYQVLAVPFTGEDRDPRPRLVEGHPQPLEESTLKPVSVEGTRGFAVGARLPVAGTAIVTSSIYGAWTVVPHLDGQLEPCGPGRHFSIRQ